ncbi:MAG: phosphotransferase family protein [Myxococcota bacterium]
MPAPQGRDFEQTRRVLARWLAERIPDAQNLEVGALSGPSATGFSSDTLIFDLAYDQGGRRVERGLVVRLEPTGVNVFPHYDVAAQYRVMDALARDGRVPVPPTLWLEEETSWLGVPFYAMERVDGRVPTDNPPYHAGGWVADEATPADREALWWSALDVLARIHATDWRALGLEFLAPSSTESTHTLRQLSDYDRYYQWALGDLRHPTVESALAWLRAEAPADGDSVGLCWGDARIGNMIFGGNECIAVLDWEMATLGNPEQDLAWFLFLDRHHSEGVETPRLPGFPGREESIARYEASTGRPVKHLHYYEVFAAMRFSVIMMRVAQQLKHAEILPSESGFEVDNTCSRLLAKLLELPPPAESLA